MNPKINNIISFSVSKEVRDLYIGGRGDNSNKTRSSNVAVVMLYIDGVAPIVSSFHRPFDAISIISDLGIGGDVNLYTCSCDTPECAGFFEPIKTEFIRNETVTWAIPKDDYLTKMNPFFGDPSDDCYRFVFDSAQYEKAVMDLEYDLVQMLKNDDIKLAPVDSCSDSGGKFDLSLILSRCREEKLKIKADDLSWVSAFPTKNQILTISHSGEHYSCDPNQMRRIVKLSMSMHQNVANSDLEMKVGYINEKLRLIRSPSTYLRLVGWENYWLKFKSNKQERLPENMPDGFFDESVIGISTQ